MQEIGWTIFNEYAEPTSKQSKEHIVDENNQNFTLCGVEIPWQAAEGDGWGVCKRCAKKAEKLEE